MIRMLLEIGGIGVCLVLIALVRVAIRRESFRYRVSDLADPSRRDIDPGWERTAKTMTRPDRRLRRLH